MASLRWPQSPSGKRVRVVPWLLVGVLSLVLVFEYRAHSEREQIWTEFRRETLFREAVAERAMEILAPTKLHIEDAKLRALREWKAKARRPEPARRVASDPRRSVSATIAYRR